MAKLTTKKCSCVVISALIGVAMLAVGIGLITVFNNLIHSEVKDEIPLKLGSKSYNNWLSPPVPLYFQVWMYDVKNFDEIMAGKKPVVEQKGPYTYREVRQKWDIAFHDNGTISYKENKTYFFDRSMSVGPEDDSFYSPNLPMVTMAMLLYQKFPWLEWGLNAAFDLIGAELFKKLTVNGLMWGYNDQSLKKLKDAIAIFSKKAAALVPERFGLFMGHNGTDDGLYTIYSGQGQKSFDNFGTILSWNGDTKLNFWTSKSANKINGSDGTLYPPFIDLGTKYLFSSDLCRSLGLDYAYDVTNRGIPMKRFIAPDMIFANHTVNPANAGFCVPAGNCLPSGLLDVSSCRQGAPIVMSMPNFSGCDEDTINAVDGVHPVDGNDQSFFDIEPMTGVVMNAGKKLQINIILEKLRGISSLKNIKKRIYFPVMWLNESALIDPKDASEFKSEVLDKIKLTDAVKYGLMAIGGFIIVMAAIFLTKWKLSKKHSDEQNSLLDRHTQVEDHQTYATNGNVVA